MTADDEPLRKAVARAPSALLRGRNPGEDQAGLLAGLRTQLRRVMADAPVSGSAVEAIAVRARLAALRDDEMSKLEARLRADDAPEGRHEGSDGLA